MRWIIPAAFALLLIGPGFGHAAIVNKGGSVYGTFTHKITNSDPTNELVSATLKIFGTVDKSNATFRRVVDSGTFTAPPNGTAVAGSSLKFTGASLAPADSTTVGFDVFLKFGYVGSGATIWNRRVTNIIYRANDLRRGTSENGDVFASAVSGGTTGTTYAGVAIPANQWGYFYEFANPSQTDLPQSFSIAIGGGAPTNSGALTSTWNAVALAADLGDPSTDESPTVNITNSMTTANLTSGGVTPLSWSYSNGAMTAQYSPGSFASSAQSSVLWFTSATPPEYGGPMGLDGNPNATLVGANGLIDVGTLVSPVPEPSSFALTIIAFFIARSARRPAR